MEELQRIVNMDTTSKFRPKSLIGTKNHDWNRVYYLKHANKDGNKNKAQSEIHEKPQVIKTRDKIIYDG